MSTSSKSRNFRRRGDENEDNESNSNTTNPSYSSRKSSSKPKKLLSFADDEEEDEETPRPSKQKPSKTKSSHKLTAPKDRLSSSSTTSTTSTNTNSNNVLLPQAGTYTKEALLELQKKTRTLAKPSSKPPPPPPSSSEPKIILKGLLKPTLPQTLNQQDADPPQDEIIIDEDYSLIPDEDTIKKIRAKRERLRQSRATAPDYISLDGGAATSDAFSDEEPEFRNRIAMIGKKDNTTPTTHAVFQDFDNGNDSHVIAEETVVNDEDEEDKIWEEEQFRKALGKRMDDPSSSTPSLFPTPSTSTITTTNNHRHSHIVPTIGGAFGPTPGLDALSVPQQSHIARKALLDNLTRLKESHNRTVSSLTKADENLSASLMNITALEKSLSAAGEKFIFMQKLRDFVSVICEFLQHKAPYIEELEEQMQTLHEQRASAILERRTADNDDEMMEVKTALEAAKKVFSARGSNEAAITAAMNAAQDASASMKEQINLPVKLDEFGRDINQQKRLDMKRRAEARQRRKAQKKLSSVEVDGSNQKVEGESSTDESDSESAAYQSNRDLLLQTADQIFGDASEEYCQLSVVKQRFENWKKEYSTSYRDAYMSISAPAIFSPYVRLELLKWDPLHEDAGFFHMKWHSLLSDYGLPQDGSDLSPEDADANLVPELVEKVAIPILHHEIAHCWDMLSTRETKNAVFATNLVTDYVPASSEALAELLLAIRTRLTDAVVSIMVPTWSPIELKAVPRAAQIAAYRFGMSVRLMKNICLWKDILSLPVLEKLALDDLLCRKVLPHLQSVASNVHDAVTRTERIIASLSGVWAGTSVTASRSHKLQPLVDCVMSLGKRLKDKHPLGASEIEVSGLARRLKKMLVELNDYDKAREIARMFSLREAL
ncbi:transcriptional repressor ILP1 [Ricinus communis]|uniref:Gc-rich sequence DNA-binding factor, putative n=1 Tax=Ricinus communis TaxID=3988 RepID=B9RGK2_RICCO|nr:transcriptional repressor ILP1 [Ricinus communis]EEF49657.1 gc-rich sequence DNA-binding factor, putative [Ricinus communis]|eukprot:XP_002513154.1 transcriptional repressor ILP1 [Ricinus communis]